MSIQQHFDYNGTDIVFMDFNEDVHSIPCQPRDIHIVSPQALDLPDVKEDIAVDIRLGQGSSYLTVRRNMKHSF